MTGDARWRHARCAANAAHFRNSVFFELVLSNSVPGDHRTAPVEMIVQTGADDLFAERGRGGEYDGRNGGCRNTERTAAEIDIEIFDLDAPVRPQHGFGAGAGGPAGTNARRRPVRTNRRGGNAAEWHVGGEEARP